MSLGPLLCCPGWLWDLGIEGYRDRTAEACPGGCSNTSSRSGSSFAGWCTGGLSVSPGSATRWHLQNCHRAVVFLLISISITSSARFPCGSTNPPFHWITDLRFDLWFVLCCCYYSCWSGPVFATRWAPLCQASASICMDSAGLADPVQARRHFLRFQKCCRRPDNLHAASHCPCWPDFVLEGTTSAYLLPPQRSSLSSRGGTGCFSGSICSECVCVSFSEPRPLSDKKSSS